MQQDYIKVPRLDRKHAKIVYNYLKLMGIADLEESYLKDIAEGNCDESLYQYVLFTFEGGFYMYCDSHVSDSDRQHHLRREIW